MSDQDSPGVRSAHPHRAAAPPVFTPKVGGDELFVPASHALVIDRQVSHPAFRLWCVLHRLWFLHEPPTMELLQELMGTTIEEKDSRSRAETCQPATRRSIERWLTELERAGWLVWSRRQETTRRYHLRTSARSAGDTAVLTGLRSLLNSSRATLADVQALLSDTREASPDAILPSHDSIARSHQDAEDETTPRQDTTVVSHARCMAETVPTAMSHHTIVESDGATAESQDPPQGSYGSTTESHGTTPQSDGLRTQSVLMRSQGPPYSEIPQNEIMRDPTPPPAPRTETGGGDGGLTDTERYLIREGFSRQAAREFRNLDRECVTRDLDRRRGFGQGIGAIVLAWRVEPPHISTEHNKHLAGAHRSVVAKSQALAIAPPDASPLEIQYLALDLEDDVPHETALARLHERRSRAPAWSSM